MESVMPRKSSATVAIALALLLTAVIAFPAHRAFAAPPGSRWGANYFPNVVLTTQNGKKVHFYDYLIKYKIVVIDFIYTHCKDMCPLETARLAQVQKILGDRVGKDIFFYSISIDPKADTASVLKAYADKYHAGPGWLFLTGKKTDIELLGKKLGVFTEREQTRDGHTPSVLIGNEKTGQWMKDGATDNPQFMASIIRNYMGEWKDRKPEAQKDYSEVAEIKITHKGQYLFATRCSACHTIGHGDKIGPDLLEATARRNRAWLARFIATPDKVLEEKDPIATAMFQKYKQIQMPNLKVSPEDVGYLIDYLETQNKGIANPSQPGTSGYDHR